jgi:K+-transporting ATPase ATPase B chain
MPASRADPMVLVALFVTLIPTTIGALLSAIGIAGMDRLVRFNVLAMSGRAVEAAGDVDTLLLDKTGTITSATGRRRGSSGRRASASLNSPMRRAAGFARRRDAGRPLDRGAGARTVRHSRPRHASHNPASCRSRASPNERRRCRRFLGARVRSTR